MGVPKLTTAELCAEFPKSKIEDLYINQNLSINACCKLLGIGSSRFYRLLKAYDIVKSADVIEQCRLSSRRRTSLERYGVEYPTMSPEVKAKSMATCVRKYGVPFYVQTLQKGVSENNPRREKALQRQVELLNTFSPSLVQDLYIYKNQSKRECAKQLNISEWDFNKLLKAYDICKSKEDISLLKSKTNTGVFKDKFKEIPFTHTTVEKFSREVASQLYIEQNLSIKQCAEATGLHRATIRKLLEYYGIKKDNKLRYSKRTQQNKREADEVLAKYLENIPREDLYNYYIVRDLTLNECCDVFGVSLAYLKKVVKIYGLKKNPSQLRRNRNKKRRESNLKRYGVVSPIQLSEIKDKVVQTCTSKYGVPYACMAIDPNKSGGRGSNVNKSFAHLLEQHGIKYRREFNIDGHAKLYDFIVDGILIDINPAYSHNSTYAYRNHGSPTDKRYHYVKSQEAIQNNFQNICIWDWDDREKIVSLLVPKDRIYARKCEVRELDKISTMSFLDRYHLQGSVRAFSCSVGLYYMGQLVAIMVFGKPRYNKKYEWELLRYCSSKNVVGGAEKIFKYFQSKYNPQSIISYCDLSKFTGNLYSKLGFSLTRTSIGKHWYNIKTKKHITNNLLMQRGFDQLLGKEYGCYGKGTSNEELMLQHGFVEIYDAGQATYVKEFK